MDNLDHLNKFSLLSWVLVLILYSFRQIDGVSIRLDLIGLLVFSLVGLLIIRDSVKGFFKLRFTQWLSFFVLWSIIVNGVYSIIYKDPIFLSDSIIYLGLFLLSIVLITHFKKNFNYIISITGPALLLSLVLVLISSIFVSETFWRHKVFFTNTNQLGRFCLFSLSILALLRYDKRFNSDSAFAIAISIASTFVMMSVSRAAILGLIILSIISLILWWKITLVGLIGGVILTSLNVSILNKHDEQNSLTKRIEERFTEKENKYDNIYYRGYNRLIESPKYFVFGAGEQYRERFDNSNFEVHSTVFGVLFNYGIVGFGLLSTAFYFLLRKVHFKRLIFIMPFLVHGLVHNDIRSIHLWLLLIILGFDLLKGKDLFDQKNKREFSHSQLLSNN